MIVMLGVLGTQEIIVLLSVVLYIGLPISLLVWFIRSINTIKYRLGAIEQTNSASEIGKLFMLKEKGAITQQEFDDRKSTLLKQR